MAATKKAPRRASRKTRKPPRGRTTGKAGKGRRTPVEAPVGELIPLDELEAVGAAAGEGGPEGFFLLYVPRR